MAIPIAAIAAAGSLAQIIGGLAAVTSKRPKYRMPPELASLAALTKARALSARAPGEQQALDIAAQNAANVLGAANVDVQGIASTVQSQMDASTLRVQAAYGDIRRQEYAQYLNALSAVASAKDLEFQMNKFAPYSQRLTAGSSAISAGIPNLLMSLLLSK